MSTITFLLLFAAPIVLFALALWRIYLRNRVHVPPGNIEWVVMENALTGQINACTAGMHFFSPAWRELRRITMNRQQHQKMGEEVKSADGTRLRIDYRYSVLLGRECEEFETKIGRTRAGKWYEFKLDPHHPYDFLVSEKAVIRAATTVKEGDVEDRIQQVIESALEETLGSLEDLQLLRPSESKPKLPSLPVRRVEGRSVPVGGVEEKKVSTVAELHTELSKRILHRANRRLLPLGLGITDFEITNLRYLDDQMQSSLEREKRNQLLADAATAYKNKIGRTNLSDRELAVIGDATFPEVARAEASRFVAAQTANAVRRGAEAIGKGLEKIGEGLGSQVVKQPLKRRRSSK